MSPQATKNTELKEFIKKEKFDIIGMAEMNLAWHRLPALTRLYHRTIRWFESRQITAAYYRGWSVNSKEQFGGTSVWSINQAAYRVCETGQDRMGLGQWAWTRYRGKNGQHLRVIAAYRPHRNDRDLASPWNQQKCFFDSIDREGDPQGLFTTDLVEEVKAFQEAGDIIILGIDVNDDVRKTNPGSCAQQICTLDLVEVITHRHGGTHTPKTFIRGKGPIDGLFVSPILQGQ